MSPLDPQKKVRVLVIDDEAAICRVVTRTLERYGFEAVSVSDANDVEKVISGSQFDVVLLDRSVTAASGSLVPLLRRAAPNVRVLYFTGDMVEAEDLALVDGVVQKPIDGKRLAETLRQVL